MPSNRGTDAFRAGKSSMTGKRVLLIDGTTKAWSWATATAGRARGTLHEIATRASHLNGLLLATLLNDLELHLLAFHERTKARRVDGGLMHEEILATSLRGNEAKAFLRVEPFNGADLLALGGLGALGPLARLHRRTATAAASTADAILEHATSRSSDIDGLQLASAVILLDLVLNLVVLIQGAEALRLDGTLVDKEILAPGIRCNKPKAFLGVEPLNCTGAGHAEKQQRDTC